MAEKFSCIIVRDFLGFKRMLHVTQSHYANIIAMVDDSSGRCTAYTSDDTHAIGAVFPLYASHLTSLQRTTLGVLRHCQPSHCHAKSRRSIPFIMKYDRC